MKEKNIRELAKRMGLVTVEDMCQYTIAQLVVKIANKVNELVNEVWRFETDVQEILKTQNENIQYLLGKGLLLEVESVFDGWVQDGTFDSLINHSALKSVNDRIDETNAQLSDVQMKTNEFEYNVTDKKLVGQGALTDVSMLMQKDFSNNKREFAFGVEVNANGSTGSLVTQDDMGHKVALYGSAQTGKNGKPFIWSLNTLAQADTGLENRCIVQGYELDVNNNQGDLYSSFDWNNGMIGGLNVTSGGIYPITFGVRIGGTKDVNTPYFPVYIEGAKDTAIHINGKVNKGIDLRQSQIATKYALVINKQHQLGCYDSSDFSYTPFIRFLNNFTVVQSQGDGFMVSNKSGSKILLQVNEDGSILADGKRLVPTLSGNTASKPSTGVVGQIYMDTSIGKPLFWNGVGWVLADGSLPS